MVHNLLGGINIGYKMCSKELECSCKYPSLGSGKFVEVKRVDSNTAIIIVSGWTGRETACLLEGQEWEL